MRRQVPITWAGRLPENSIWLLGAGRRTQSGFERPFFRLAASGSIDDETNIACFAVFVRRKNCSLRADEHVFRQSLGCLQAREDDCRPKSRTLSESDRPVLNERSIVKYKLIIFDFDGTLADTYLWFTSILNQVADKYKFRRVAQNEYQMLRELSARRVMQHLGISTWKMPFISNHVRRLMARDLHRISLFDGVDELLERLSAMGVALAVASSNSSHNVHSVLGPKNTALISYYECGVSFFSKTARLKKIIRTSGLARSETLYVGDEIRDLEAARKANIQFGGVSWGYNKAESLAERSPGELFSSVEEIAECAS